MAELQDTGAFTNEYTLCFDARSIYDAVARDGEVLTGSDPSLTMHVKSLRDKVQSGEINCLTWIDNRDMVADGLTKGKAPRDELLAISQGRWNLQHATLTYTSKTHNKDLQTSE